jgi:Amt family ammonium transporter
MFAVITPALITGAFAERMKFKGFLFFTVSWLLLVYCPVAHWVWGEGGWLQRLGTLDFAGGIVVHANSGLAALAAAILLRHRKGYGKEPFLPHNLTLTLLGAGILWFGWFGFNAGSALVSGGLAASAFVATNLAAAAGMIAWAATERLHRGTPTTLGAATGAVAGLATITPASGFVSPMAAILIGLIAGAVCYAGVLAKQKLAYDDSLDVVGVHGVGGTLGALLTGLFASTAINPKGANGLFFGNPAQLGLQALAVLVTIIYSFGVSFALLKLADALVGLRVTEDQEETGLDLSQHSETGYAM